MTAGTEAGANTSLFKRNEWREDDCLQSIMKVETPMVRWHQIINPQSKRDAGANGPILSCSLLTAGDVGGAGVLATAGNTEVNVWRVRFTDDAARCGGAGSHILVQPRTSNTPTATDNAGTEHTGIEHVATLSRGMSERSVNAVRFSPSGKHLVAAGDGGTVVVWSLPSALTDATLLKNAASALQETDFPMKILFNQSDDVMDVAWSPDSRRFAVCSLDHTMVVWELNGADGEWRIVHRSAKDHTHYVQGVAYDPQGVYLASMGSDRMVKVYSRTGAKANVIRGELAKYEVERLGGGNIDGDEKGREERDRRAILQNKVLPELLASSAFALHGKIKTLKYLRARRHHMFTDELTLGSFFRRLAFTPDGAFLVVPAALWHGTGDKSAAAGEESTAAGDEPAAPGASAPERPGSPTSVANGVEGLAESSFCTYLFARHRFDRPYKVLAGLEKPSVAVRPNPVLFKLPLNTEESPLPYRSVFAVLTADAVLLYDTHHDRPLAMARGLHYAGLTDAAWSGDGRTLLVTSSDGYVSILSFGEGELGEVYAPPMARIVEKKVEKEVFQVTDASEPGEKVGSAERSEIDVTVVDEPTPSDEAKNSTSEAPGGAAEGVSARRVTFSPVNQVQRIDTQQTMSVNTLIPKRKKAAPAVVAPSPQQGRLGDGGMEASGGTACTKDGKRLVEDTPATSQSPAPVNILIAKKKKKVNASSMSVTTM